jgi:hypothetical protein
MMENLILFDGWWDFGRSQRRKEPAAPQACQNIKAGGRISLKSRII